MNRIPYFIRRSAYSTCRHISHVECPVRRYNKVLLDSTAIERERERLSHENGDLRSILKQYLDGISVNEDVSPIYIHIYTVEER